MANHEAEREAQGLELIATDVRGLQVGEHNFQLNSYEFNIAPEVVDLEAVFERPVVAEALERLALDPSSRELMQIADRALRSSGLTGPGIADATVELTRHESYAGANGFLSLLFRNASGVQVGDHSRQENYFHYLVAPDIEAGRMLAENNVLRKEIISCVISSKEKPNEKLATAFNRSIERAAGSFVADGRGGVVIRPRAGRTIRISSIDGATVGWDVDQVNRIKTAVQVPILPRLQP